VAGAGNSQDPPTQVKFTRFMINIVARGSAHIHQIWIQHGVNCDKIHIDADLRERTSAERFR
jgi:hypothetical protein